MAIGLTADELIGTFFESMSKRLSNVSSGLEAIKAGESPDEEKLLSQLRDKFPQTSPEQILMIGIIFMSLMDTIVSNNASLAKVIPHLEV
ncbi:MAG: hypothetical protein Q8O43_02890 [Dehalococcoidia bacterium]|nr:hypothetical protein [Dehalococcoidia bacterium]